MNAGASAVHHIDDLLAAPVLVVDGRELTGRDLLAAGVVSGRWQRLEQELFEGIGLVAVEAPADAAVNDALRAFRFERGLLSAADLRGWMGARGLSLAALKDALARSLVRTAGGRRQAVEAGQVEAALPAELICTGALGELGFWLADRLLSATVTHPDGVQPFALERVSVQRLVFEEARTVAGGARPEAGVERARRLAAIAALDEAHRAWESAAVSNAEIARRLHEKQLEWCRFELDVLALPSPGGAAEAARQLAEGSGPAHVAEIAGVPPAVDSVLLVEAPPELARLLTGAVVGDVVGPWSVGAAHVVARVRERRPPEIDDVASFTRAREELLAETTMRLRAGRVRWHERT